MNLFSLCTYQVFRNHSADLHSPSLSLTDNLIVAQTNPIILENLGDSSFINHRYFLINETNQKNNSGVDHWLQFQTHSIRLHCRVLLTDFDGVTDNFAIGIKGQLNPNWKGLITRNLLHGLAGFRESPDFIIFQDSKFSVLQQYFSWFANHSQEYSIPSQYIWLTTSESFLFCKTCPSQLMPLSLEHLKKIQILKLYWKEIHRNLHLAKVVHFSGAVVSKKRCILNEGRNDTSHYICLYVTLSQRYNYTFYFTYEKLPKHAVVGSALFLFAIKNQIRNIVLERVNFFTYLGIGSICHEYNFQVFIPSKILRSSSIAGLFALFDIPTWMAFSVTMITTGFSFWVFNATRRETS